MTQYKYTLDSSSKKYNCPSCNKKRFVRYIETETGNYAEDHFGRCDREVSCGLRAYPKSGTFPHLNFTPKVIIPPAPSFIDNALVQRTLSNFEINPLVTYLINRFGQETTIQVILEYKVGTAKKFNGSTVFYQIDTDGRVRTGKIMGYDAVTGKRCKGEQGPQITWVHSALRLPHFHLSQCLFGLHLLNQDTQKVAIVESEKTALFMRLEFPDYTWMATGSLSGFKHEYLAPLKEFNVIAFPDNGAYDQWHQTATSMNELGFSIEVSTAIEDASYETGWDLVDVFLFEESKPETPGDEG